MSEKLKFSEKDVEDFLMEHYSNLPPKKGHHLRFVERQVSLGSWGVADIVQGSVSGDGTPIIEIVEIKAVPATSEHLAQLSRYMAGAEKHSSACVFGTLVALEYRKGHNNFPFLLGHLKNVRFEPYSVSLFEGFHWESPFKPEDWDIGDGHIGKSWAPLMKMLGKQNPEVQDDDTVHKD